MVSRPPSDSPAGRVAAVLEVLGASIEEQDHRGGTTFDLDGMRGFAREREGLFRSSFFVAEDMDRDTAEDWIGERGGVPHGHVEFFNGDNFDAIRYLVELPYEDHQAIWVAGQTARVLHAAWHSTDGGYENLAEMMARIGLVVPPTGSVDPRDIREYGPWCWCSHFVPPQVLYMYEVDFIANQLCENGPFFALAHAGHGWNSYGLNLVTSAGPIAAYVQHGWDGMFMDPVRSRIAINITYSRLHVLMRTAADLPMDDVRWLLTLSDFRMGMSLIDLDAVRAGAEIGNAARHFKRESDLFKAVAGLPQFEGEDFGAQGAISW